ncbi:MAG: hypothetical protein N2378_03980 [Chloroflexaceae bacterium]|nr:hypothetical protein [Chloroflexaceae bacterium]
MAEHPAVTAPTTALPPRPADWREAIAGAVAELDLRQVAIAQRLTPAERVAQAISMIEAVEQAAAYLLRQRQPELSENEALRLVRMRAHAW